MRTLTTTALRSLPALALTLACSTAALANDRQEIEIRGRLLLDGATTADAILVVEVNEVDCVPFDFYPDGRFVLTVPVDSKAQIRFEKPGYMSKEVALDTRNALLTAKAVKLNKRVDFDVLLQPLPAKDMAYAGPVGDITFVKGSGLMKVRTDRTLIDTPQQLAAAKREEK